MTGHRTDCVQKPLALLFEKLGHLVGSHPIWFMVVPLLVSVGLGGGFYFLKDREDNDIERQFTPTSGWSKEARRFVRDNFPHDDSMFSVQRLHSEGIYASVILSSRNDGNIFTEAAFRDIIHLDSKVKNISVASNDRYFRYENLCARMKDKCPPNVILSIIGYEPKKIEHARISFPLHNFRGRPEFLGLTVGGVNQSEGMIQSAQAVRLFYFLEDARNSYLWLKQFQRVMLSEHSYGQIKVCNLSQGRMTYIDVMIYFSIVLFHSPEKSIVNPFFHLLKSCRFYVGLLIKKKNVSTQYRKVF